ncbi:hypothetical protein TRFO_25880 [Tritrichomonas foetus]|uniref:Uncharacterized protein n=1 Tax=Tritrichomonas foetus TaxID=1144522 RepID=A0A1J4K5B2_9EUKA|nr:hypothetical protein TRFO_25880 [Tritrichomonas foetus]|eukprot:OHT06178.1 hypothetical protein TRFO_25880 [Tritrichomonas foetus]
MLSETQMTTNLSISQFNELIGQIVTYLHDDPERFRELKLILSRFKRSPKNPYFTLTQIKSILSENAEICRRIDSMIEQFPEDNELSLHFSNFINEINQVSNNPKLGFILAEALSYYSEELITLQFLHYFISLLISDLPIEIQKETQNKIHYLALEINFNRIQILKINNDANLLINTFPMKFDMDPVFATPSQIQFLVMVNLLINSTENIASIIKCMKMYGNGVIIDQEAVEWVNQFDTFLGNFFKGIITSTEPCTFLPANLKITIDSHIPSESQRIWAIGDFLYDLISNQAKISENENSTSSYSSNTTNNTSHSISNTALENHDRKNMFLPQSLLSLRTSVFYNSISSAMKNVQENKSMGFSQQIIEAIYGKVVDFHNNDNSYGSGVVFKRCNQFGGEAVDKKVRLLSSEMSQLDPINDEWRIHYVALMKPAFVKELLVFQGFQTSIPQNIQSYSRSQKNKKTIDDLNLSIHQTANEILINFCERFKSISPDFMKNFLKCFDNGIHYCGVKAAMCLHYYFCLVHSIKCSIDTLSDTLGDFDDIMKLLKSIPQIVFQSITPISEFGSTSLAHVDVPLKEFAKCAVKIKDEVCSNDISVILENSAQIHFFEIIVEDNKMKVTSSVIPSATVTPVMPQQEVESKQEKDVSSPEP